MKTLLESTPSTEPRIDSAQIEQWMSPRPLQSWLAISFTWSGIGSFIYLFYKLNNPYLILPALMVIGAFQHRFFTIYHDAFHHTLFKNTRLNDAIGKWLAAYPALVSYESARARHLMHHAQATTDMDPERVSHIRAWREMVKLYFPWPAIAFSIMARLGLPSWQWVPAGRAAWSSAEKTGWGEILAVLFVQAGLFCLFVALFGWWGLLYHGALFSFNLLFSQTRQWVEHYEGDKEPGHDPRYVFIQPNWIERFLLAPMNFNCHAAHHMYPRIPFSQLPEAQAFIIQQYPALIQRKGYIRLILKELVW